VCYWVAYLSPLLPKCLRALGGLDICGTATGRYGIQLRIRHANRSSNSRLCFDFRFFGLRLLLGLLLIENPAIATGAGDSIGAVPVKVVEVPPGTIIKANAVPTLASATAAAVGEIDVLLTIGLPAD
jgi:hypothetical protein